jgi:hypothetical protein
MDTIDDLLDEQHGCTHHFPSSLNSGDEWFVEILMELVKHEIEHLTADHAAHDIAHLFDCARKARCGEEKL